MTMIKKQGKENQLPVPQMITYSLRVKVFFLQKQQKAKSVYTRLGEFKFDGEGVYRAKNGNTVQGYILNDKGEIMQGTKSVSQDLYEQTALKGGSLDIRRQIQNVD